MEAEEQDYQTSGIATSSRPPRPQSFAWSYFEKQATEDPRKFWEHCLVCRDQRWDQRYKWKVGGGTGTLLRHLETTHGITSKTEASQAAGGGQSQLHGYFAEIPGGGTPFHYTRERMIDGFAQWVIADELPFNTEESRSFEYFTRTSLQPAYRPIPRNTLKNRT